MSTPAICSPGARMKIQLIYCWIDNKNENSNNSVPQIEIEQSAKVKDLDAELKKNWPAEGYEQFENADSIRLISGGKQYSTDADSALFELIPSIDKPAKCPKINLYIAPVEAGVKAKQAEMQRESKGGGAVEMASRACHCAIL